MCWDDEDVEPFEGGVRSIQSSFFCNICVEEILAGNRSLGTLNARGYINLGHFFSQTWKQYTQNQYFWKIILDQYWSREEPSYGGSHGKSRLVGGQHKG
jgi:hypothetical protein